MRLWRDRFRFRITWSEPVVNFHAANITVINGVASDLTRVTADNTTFDVTIAARSTFCTTTRACMWWCLR
jgi:hypothetical protein